MGILDGLENILERSVRKIFSAGGSKGIKPVEVTNAMRTEMDNRAVTISQDRTLVPNMYTIAFSEDDFTQVQQWGRALAEELCDEAIRHASVQGYSLSGPVRVTFISDEDVVKGNMQIESSTESSEDIDPGQPISYSADKHVSSPAVQPPLEMTDPNMRVDQTDWRPVVEIEGTRYAINSSAAVIGRSSDADITVADPGMSRRHLQISVAGDRVSAVDMGSTNGFYVNGQKAANTVDLHHGDIITAGRTTIVFRLAPDTTTQTRR
ncbi:MAG: DUF3662 domain-containing protein [Yaniella sp.]|uniref:FhaA domain-containing protein n=1 Tax=Yaniella sp. TaxID=2773929 RepID=UPI00264714C8|nr:DUF3662 and FHA domain-containing protein [Yaniella sp.]MDN5732395.1 DUF3662 domain-containing protein [Yaniella sp.]MDN5816018.1 DUF3662 domain-containing protein [Yaniella sp.]MDN5839093.1 DUF3662 domain-containing protein [Yaniella sp.]MDN5890052.1 DUF3662 domain-containing protein [Yaniella sp.]MDN5913132.1 DUF3662 domain-containing protein [Yaniella sp.]